MFLGNPVRVVTRCAERRPTIPTEEARARAGGPPTT